MKKSIFAFIFFISIHLYIYIIPFYKYSCMYGISFNEDRKNENIPTIPTNWTYSKSSKNWIIWKPSREEINVHIGKEINFNGFDIIEERDTYKTDTIYIEISNYYNKENKTSYTLYSENTKQAKTINKNQLDSILHKLNINIK